MKRAWLVLTLLAMPLAAQEKKVEEQAKQASPPNQQKVFILKYADPENLRQLLSVFGGGFIPNAEMHALAVTAPPSMMQAIEDAITRLDVPSAAPKNFDFTVDLVVGTDAENPVSASIPKDLDSVIAQLKGAFPFKNYRLLDVLTLRTRAGKRASAESSGGAVQVGSASRTVRSEFAIDSASLGADGTTVHLDRLKCQIRFPYEDTPGQIVMQNLSLQTEVDIKEGQKVVVGRVGMNSQQAMFVVLTVKVVQ
jgi:hypothetical protein